VTEDEFDDRKVVTIISRDERGRWFQTLTAETFQTIMDKFWDRENEK